MATDTDIPSSRPLDGPGALLRLAPLPLFPLQPLLGRIVRKIAAQRPEIFGRIGPHIHKCFQIDPVNLPFVLMLHPDPAAPRLRAARRRDAPAYDARIAGSFLTLLAVADGRLDGDALFFTRELVVEGDTEAAVCLRNALDDLDGSIADDIADMFGPPGRAALALLRRAGNDDGRN
jgi:predicted lipid carrier protein YhbT